MSARNVKYRFTTLEAAGKRAEDLVPLVDAAFAQYEGVIRVDGAFLDWFMRRPGLGSAHSFVCLHGDTLVANVFLTVTPVRLGGEVVGTGIIDTVCTHPEHQRQGLARELMLRVLAYQREQGMDVSLLFTQPGSVPSRFYERLDYREIVRVHAFAGVPDGAGTRTATRTEPADVRDLVERHLSERDGFLPLSDDLWRWRRERRPSSLPTTCYTVEGDGRVAAATVCEADLVTSGVSRPALTVTDVAMPVGTPPGDVVWAVYTAHGKALPMTWLVGDCNEPEVAAADRLGLTGMPECAMACGLTEHGRELLNRPVQAWYTPSESLIGV